MRCGTPNLYVLLTLYWLAFALGAKGRFAVSLDFITTVFTKILDIYKAQGTIMLVLCILFTALSLLSGMVPHTAAVPSLRMATANWPKGDRLFRVLKASSFTEAKSAGGRSAMFPPAMTTDPSALTTPVDQVASK